LQTIAALASDVAHLMDALPALANMLRYGNVRKTDSEMVRHVVDGLVARICVGLPAACGALNDEAAEEMFGRIQRVHGAIALLQNAEHGRMWNQVLAALADAPNEHGLIAGRATRLLLDAKEMAATEAARRFGLALSRANLPAASAAWVDGFVRSSGLLLLHDEDLWRVLDEWVTHLSEENFTATLPLLRRTFSTFEHGERRQLGVRVARGESGKPASRTGASERFDPARAETVLPLLAQLLGVKPPVESK
jgi:hypothetical protein